MKQCCDLHTHSTFSDGTDAPGTILDTAVKLGLSAVALTDHNTVAGLPEFTKSAIGRDILAIPGVEISTGYLGKELHILGLFLNPEHYDKITAFLSVINARKTESNKLLLQNLNHAGYSLDYDEITQKHRGNVNRAVIAEALLAKGYISDIKEAFQGLLSAKHGYYQPPERITAFDAIGFLDTIGAVSVLAHPFLSLSEEELTAFLPKAQSVGLKAMETHYSTYSPDTTVTAIRIAERFHLLPSGGSDYHGRNKPDIQLGTGYGSLAVPDTFAQNLYNQQLP